MPGNIDAYTFAQSQRMMSASPLANDYHVLMLSSGDKPLHIELLSIKEMDTEKQNQILDAVDKLMSKH